MFECSTDHMCNQYMQAWYEVIWNIRQGHLAQQKQYWKKVPRPHVAPISKMQRVWSMVYGILSHHLTYVVFPNKPCDLKVVSTDVCVCVLTLVWLSLANSHCNHCSPALVFFFHESALLEILVKCYEVYRHNCQLPPFEDGIPFENATQHHAWELREHTR